MIEYHGRRCGVARGRRECQLTYHANMVCKNCQRHICRGKNECQEQRTAHKHDQR